MKRFGNWAPSHRLSKSCRIQERMRCCDSDRRIRGRPGRVRAAIAQSICGLRRRAAGTATRLPWHARPARDAAEARRILEGASTGARLDDARERPRVYVKLRWRCRWIIRTPGLDQTGVSRRWRGGVSKSHREANRTPSPRLAKNRRKKRTRHNLGFPHAESGACEQTPPLQKRGPGPSCP